MNQTHFGFKTVSSDEKTPLVQQLFSRVSGRYDLMNDSMSLGIHRYWKFDMVRRLPVKANSFILDVAGGTGDIACRLLETYPHLNLKISVCDLTEGMIIEGRDRALNQGISSQIQWICGNAESLPLPDASVDLYTISFGLRNITNIDKALQEAYRVLKPTGNFACLEFSQVGLPVLNRLYELYSFSLIPWLGDLIANDRDAYQYLVESIRRFPHQEKLAQMISSVGFREVGWKNYMGGVSCLHQAIKY